MRRPEGAAGEKAQNSVCQEVKAEGRNAEESLRRRIREAHFVENKTLEGFDWNFNPKIFDPVQMEELATGDFIRRGTNLVMVGWSGIGKSHIVQTLGQKACVNGHRVLYQTSAQLLADLTASLADKTLPTRLRRYASPDLLVIDEFGFDKIERNECPEAAHLLYKIIASRNQKRSTALVTNVDFEKWGEYLSDGPLAMAFLDRLVEGAIILKLKGKSYRAEKAKALESRSTLNRNLSPPETATSPSDHRVTQHRSLSACQNGPFSRCHRQKFSTPGSGCTFQSQYNPSTP